MEQGGTTNKEEQAETLGKLKQQMVECMQALCLQHDIILRDQAKRIQVFVNQEEVSLEKMRSGEFVHVHEANGC